MDKSNPLPLLAALAMVFAAALPGMAIAQERSQPTLEFAAGSLFFPDDALVTETMIGGAARFYLLPRISVGPEFAHIQGDNHSHLMLTGNLTVDLLSPVNGRPRRVNPFVVAGGGWYRTREQFPNEIFTSSEGAFTAGGGVRALVGRRLVVGAEARIGWELHLRLNGMVGVRLGK